MRLKAGYALQYGVAPLFEADIVIRRHAVDAGDLVAVREQAPRQMKPDKTRSSSHQIAHRRIVLSIREVPQAAIAARSIPAGSASIGRRSQKRRRI
jgi:hypothetical protein